MLNLNWLNIMCEFIGICELFFNVLINPLPLNYVCVFNNNSTVPGMEVIANPNSHHIVTYPLVTIGCSVAIQQNGVGG